MSNPLGNTMSRQGTNKWVLDYYSFLGCSVDSQANVRVSARFKQVSEDIRKIRKHAFFISVILILS